MYCNKCGKEVFDEYNVCPYCGNQLHQSYANENYSYFQPNQSPVKEEKANIGLCILSFLIPIAGLIIFLVNKDKHKKTAKAAGICALVSFAINIVCYGMSNNLTDYMASDNNSFYSGDYNDDYNNEYGKEIVYSIDNNYQNINVADTSNI